MIHGLDTGFLVAFEVQEHPDHLAARTRLGELVADGDTLALAPQVLAEFLHIVTDAKRFQAPLTMPQAIGVIDHGGGLRETSLPSTQAIRQPGNFSSGCVSISLGRKRLLDTLLAATYWQAGVSSLLTTNPSDFAVFGCFHCVTPQG
jgi:predicted nucleic acid-binding protein